MKRKSLLFVAFAGSRWKTTRASNWTAPHYNEFWFTGMDDHRRLRIT